MSSDDPKKPPQPQRTVLRPLPGGAGPMPPQPPQAPPADMGGPRPMPGQGAAPGGGGQRPPQQPQRTVIGGLPPMPGPGQGGGGAGWGGGGGGGGGGGFGGADLDRGPPAQPGGYGGPPAGSGYGAPPPAQGGFGGGSGGWPGSGPSAGASPFDAYAPPPGPPGQGAHWLGTSGRSDESFFPEQRRPEPVQYAPTRKISLEDALRVRAAGHSAEANPITAAAASLLILFGRLRSQVVDMQAVPLMAHVTDEIVAFEKRVLEAGVDPQDAMIAKYALCGTADDIVQNLPGTDRDVWTQYSMVARFFNKRTAGVGFFEEVQKALADPVRKYHLLELMLTCLQLGFEGQYRVMPGGDVELQRIRRQIYETLRRVKPRGDDDISPRWKGVAIAMRRRRGGLPIWVAACFAGAVLVGSYLVMRQFVTDEGDRVAESMLSVTPHVMVTVKPPPHVEPAPAVYTPPPYTPPPDQGPTQLDRMRTALKSDIDGKALTVDAHGDSIAVTVNNLMLFDSGRADVKAQFADLAKRIGAALDKEPGKITVVGHTDNVPLAGTGRFKNNFDLSVARAKAVAKVLATTLSKPDRITVEGKGADDPIADNGTAEGRAQNRRVEILLQRQETLAGETAGDAAAVAVAAKPAAGN